MPKVTIVQLTWNTEEDTREALESMVGQSFKDFEVLVVDNGSNPENRARLKGYLKDVKGLRMRLLELDQNRGYSGGCNAGFAACDSPYVLLLNNDVIVKDKDWLKNLLAPMKDPKVAMTVSKVIHYDGVNNNILQFGGGHLTLLGLPKHEGMGKPDSPEYGATRQTFWGMGVAYVVRRSVIEQMEEFMCPEYYTYFEEIDLCWRLNNLGYKIVFCGNAPIYHKGSVTVKKNKMLNTQDRYSMRNKYLTYWRNLPRWQAAAIFPLIVGLDFVRSCKRGGDFFKYYFGALREFLKIYPKVKKYRNGSLRQLTWR